MRSRLKLAPLAFALLLVSCDSGPDTAPLPAPPQLTAPTDRADDQATAVELVWSPSDDATSYRVQVALSPAFQETVIDAPGVAGTIYPLGNLGLYTTYFWRVCAEGPSGESDWSQTWSFMASVEASMPGRPALVYPEHGTEGLPTEIVFRWEAAPHASSYELQVALEDDFLRNEAYLMGIRDTQQRVHGLVKSYTYFWRVRAQNPLGRGSWSPPRVLVITK